MIAHQIENGIVVNTIEVDTLDFLPNLIPAMGGGIGWTWDGTNLKPPPPPVLTPEQQREKAKAARETAVAAIKVTTAAGNTFDGDETSQTRMARAIIALNVAPPETTVNWVLADNSVINATSAELTEALYLAGEAQAAIWVIA